MKFKLKYTKPTRNQLWGMSPSEFKTMLKRRGHSVPRDFFKRSVSHYKGRAYRFRWWGDVYGDDTGEFFVDVSCPLKEFDRWANSVDEVVNFYNWIEK